MEKEGDECLREGIMDGFDENIVIEILVHLPLKKKFQCKLVCKRWSSLISSPLFAQRVLATKLPSSMPWFLIYRYEVDSHYSPPDDFDTYWERDFQTASDHNSDETIIPQLAFNLCLQYPRSTLYVAHNGLILCHTYKNFGWGEGWLVCNPLTGKRVSIPDLRLSSRCLALVGFIVGFNNGRTQFKVVMAPCQCLHNDEYTCEYSNFEVFSSEVGEWRDTGVSFPLIGDWFREKSIGVVYDGKLVWEMSSRLAVFDPDKNECRIFSLNLPVNLTIGGKIGTCCGRLCYASNAAKYEVGEDSLCVYVLENYEKQEWRQLLMTQISSVFDKNEIVTNYREFWMMPLAFHPFDMNIVYFELYNFECDSTALVSFNLQTNKLKGFTGQQIPKHVFVGMPISIFVLPPWPTSVPKLSYDYNNQDYGSDLRRLFSESYYNHIDDFGSDFSYLFSL